MELVPLVALGATVTLAIGIMALGVLVAVAPDDEADLAAFAADRDELADLGRAL
jgi:hypothetical protein